MNEQTAFIVFYALLFLGFSCLIVGVYLKSVQKIKLDYNEQFMLFLSERGIYWLYRNDLNTDCEPEEFVRRITGYNRQSCFWVKLNAQWIERLGEISKI